jgi:hypothetical protein
VDASDGIVIELFEEEAPPEEVDRVTRALRTDLRELDDVDDVVPVPAGPAPEGSRGMDVQSIGALLVVGEATVGLVRQVLDLVQSWLKRGSGGGGGSAGQGRTMKITVNGHTIELTPTAEQQQALVDKFLAEAVAPPPTG